MAGPANQGRRAFEGRRSPDFGSKVRGEEWIDTCRGTPDAWREEALRKAVPFCGMQRLMFGVDSTPARLAENAPVHVAKDRMILQNVMGLTEEQIGMFFWGACEAFYSE